MQTTVVTAFSAEGYEQYGRRLIETYDRFGKALPLHVYSQDVHLIGGCAQQFPQSVCPGLDLFLAECAQVPEACGRKDQGSWKEKEIKAQYSYRFDAFKFVKMVAVMHAAGHNLGAGYMVWLDGDTVVRKPIPLDLAERSLPKGCDYAYLGREPKHTETGYVVFRLPEALPILDTWVNFYWSWKFLKQTEWHSAYLFDRARGAHPDIKGHNLTPGARGHAIHQCWVGGIFDHCKGKRKAKGRSPEAKN